MIKKIDGLLGIAKRSGHLASGQDMTLECIRAEQAYLCIVATDASDNTKKRFKDSCTYYDVPYFEYLDKEGLGHLIGREVCASMCITDKGLSDAVLKKINMSDIHKEVE